MEMLTKILLTLTTIDLVVFPFYMVWIIRRGTWRYDFQQFHRAFHLVQLLIFVLFVFSLNDINMPERLLLAVYITACLQHNFKLHQFLTPRAINGVVFPYVGPSAMHYFQMLWQDIETSAFIYVDITRKGVFADPEEYDVVNRFSGKSWGLFQYIKNYGVRLTCDILAISSILVFLG